MDTETKDAPERSGTGPDTPSAPETETPQAPTEAPAANTPSGKPLRDVGESRGPAPEAQGAAAVGAVADPQLRTSPTEDASALDWLIAARQAQAEGDVETKTLEIQFGGRWITWVIQPVGIDRMRSIRRQAANTREARKTGTVDEYRVNLEMVAAGTIDPNINQTAKLAAAQGIGSPEPIEVLRQGFQSKPGYIAQIAGEIMQLSGFDDADVREADMVEAGKDSS